ncbi:MAG TPA: hypothetical protein VMW91_07675 [Desulfosporosinus sp.]|nr:hypothetical protein [Desulfosporosinus sp.]
MKEKFKAEINKQNFTLFEWAGMKMNPKLTLEIGMALGYKMALNDVEKEVNKRETPVAKKLDIQN